MRQPIVFALQISLFLSTGLVNRAQATGTLPAEVQSALELNAEEFSPLTVSWTQQNHTQLTGDKLKELQIDDPNLFLATPVRLSWAEGKFHCFMQQSSGGSFESAFDGKVFSTGCPDSKLSGGALHPYIVRSLMSKVSRETPNVGCLFDDYIVAAGFWMPWRMQDLQQGLPVRSEILRMLETKGAIQAVENGTASGTPAMHVKLVTENAEWRRGEDIDLIEDEKELRDQGRPSEEFIQRELARVKALRSLPHEVICDFYLDPALNYAIVEKDEKYPDGTILTRLRNSDFEKIGKRSLYLPRKSRVDHYAWKTVPGKFFKAPPINTTYDVTSFDAASPASQEFSLNYTYPGTEITDTTSSGKPETYQVAASLDDLDKAVTASQAEQPVAVVENHALPVDKNSSLIWLYIIGPIVLMIVVVSFILRHYWRAK